MGLGFRLAFGGGARARVRVRVRVGGRSRVRAVSGTHESPILYARGGLCHDIS